MRASLETEVKRVTDSERWQNISEVYCSLLDDLAKEIRATKAPTDKASAKRLTSAIEKANDLGKQLHRYIVVEAKSEYGF